MEPSVSILASENRGPLPDPLRESAPAHGQVYRPATTARPTGAIKVRSRTWPIAGTCTSDSICEGALAGPESPQLHAFDIVHQD